jgi:hypothetical protein
MKQDEKLCPYDVLLEKPNYSRCQGDKCALWVKASWDGQPVEGCAKWVEVQLYYLRWELNPDI